MGKTAGSTCTAWSGAMSPTPRTSSKSWCSLPFCLSFHCQHLVEQLPFIPKSPFIVPGNQHQEPTNCGDSHERLVVPQSLHLHGHNPHQGANCRGRGPVEGWQAKPG